MRTNYQNLNSFEMSAIILAAAGLGLISTMIFSALPAQQQNHFIAALSVFDIHTQADAQVQAATKIFAAEENFMNDFYVSFTQIASLPDSVMEVPSTVAQTYQLFLSYADGVASDYQLTYAPPTRQLAFEPGLVSGIAIEQRSESSGCSEPEAGSVSQELFLPYTFQPPDLDNFRQKVEGFTSRISLIK